MIAKFCIDHSQKGYLTGVKLYLVASGIVKCFIWLQKLKLSKVSETLPIVFVLPHFFCTSFYKMNVLDHNDNNNSNSLIVFKTTQFMINFSLFVLKVIFNGISKFSFLMN